MRELSEIKAEIEKRSETRLKKRRTAAAPLILAAALLVCVALSTVLVMSIKADDTTEKELIKDVIYRAEVVTMEASTIPEDVLSRASEENLNTSPQPKGPTESNYLADAILSETGIIPNRLPDEEKERLINSYVSALKEIYTASASQLYTYSDIRRQLMNSDEEYYDRVYDHGVFEIVINSSKIKGDSAAVNATVYSWQKYIISAEGPSFTLSFPVARTTYDYELEKADGHWMIASQTMKDYVFDADDSLNKTFDNYADAAEYAKGVTVKNLFAAPKEP